MNLPRKASAWTASAGPPPKFEGLTPPMPKVLAIDDDRAVLHMIRQSFKDSDIEIATAGTVTEGLELLKRDSPDVVLLDIMLPEMSGLEAFQQIHKFDTKLPVVFITAAGDSDTAIEAMKVGAYDYVPKPLELPKVRRIIEQALETRRLMRVPVALPTAESPATDGDLLVGRSPAMLDVFKAIGRVAPQDVTVLIHGESGTGKELVARAIYQHSKRSRGPFLAVNCAAIPDSLLESELFGHEKGAFTGADSQRIGKFEQCSGGTIFLDEIGDMAPIVQGKVLRLLQDQKFERVGGNRTITTDVRIVAATNRNLEQMCEEGKYRPDLYYRLNGFPINLPRLADRGNDILLLLEHFLARFSRQMGRGDVEGISPDAVNLLMRYDWPGNVRELQSIVKQALLNSSGPVIVPDFLPEDVRTGGKKRSNGQPAEENGLPERDLGEFIDRRVAANSQNLYAETLEMMERYVVTRVLRMTGGNQSQAARSLGITRGSLRNKIRTLGISIDHVVDIDGALPEDEEDED